MLTMQVERRTKRVHASLNQTAISLIKLGSEYLCREDLNGASASFDAAQAVLTVPLSSQSCLIAVNCLEMGKRVLESKISQASIPDTELTIYVPDIYEEDECDVGPRMMRTPILPGQTSENDVPLLECIVLYNKGLLFHKLGNFSQAKEMFEISAYSVQTMLGFSWGSPSVTFLLLAMRAHNNLGMLSYHERKEGVSAASFEAAVQFGKHLSMISSSYKLEYTVALSNWCRVHWMRGDITNSLYQPLEEILRIRTQTLSWDHADVAAAHYNLAVAEYSRQNSQKSITHLKQYLTIAKQQEKAGQKDLDPIPALIYLLLIENEDKDDVYSHDLVRGLRALHEKRQEFGPNSVEVACVLNYVGTLLFHQQHYESALVFFFEELRLEDAKQKSRPDDHVEDRLLETTSISVTCNNIGRILQELGKYEDAISFYCRALQPVYGDISKCLRNPFNEPAVKMSLKTQLPSSANLYSTVWYNLGLIYDKLGGYTEAVSAFEVSLQLRKALLGSNHSDIACLLYNIGVLQMEQERLDAATVSFREALAIRRLASAGRLNDRHVIKTLVKLAALQRDKGNVFGALDVAKEILVIQENTNEYDDVTRMKEIGATLRFTGELHHTLGDLDTAISVSIESVNKLRIAAAMSAKMQSHNFDLYAESLLIKDRIANIEQFVLTLLLLGSLYHEIGDPLNATTVLSEAATIVQGTVSTSSICPAIAIPSTLYALQEVTAMLGTFQCAPMA
jgi:tetratricopeptide (TPR) repeat protein